MLKQRGYTCNLRAENIPVSLDHMKLSVATSGKEARKPEMGHRFLFTLYAFVLIFQIRY